MSSKANKTQVTAVSVEGFLAAVEPPARREDARAVCAMMGRLSGEAPRMWGPSIVGFGVRHYRYDSGREGDMLKVGFSPRKQALVLYVTTSAENNPLVLSLGKVTTGKSCIYVKSLADIHLDRLEALIAASLASAAG